MTAGERNREDLALRDGAALPVPAAAEPSRFRTRLKPGRSARISSRLARRLDPLRDLWDGASWEPGHDWLTRAVPPPGDRQEPM